MAAFNFPNSPSTNDIHTENNVSWKWNGTVWKKVASPDTIAKADSKVQVVDAGTGGYITAETDGTQRLRVQNSGAIVTGILTATSFKGDGSALTGISGVTINNNANNRVITGSGTAATLEAETSLEWNGTETLKVVHGSSYPDFRVQHSAGGGTFESFRCGNGPFRIKNTTQSFYSAADELAIGSGSGDRGLTIYSGSSDSGVIAFADGTSDPAYRMGQIIYGHGDNSMTFRTNGNTERLRIDSSGRLLLGTTTIGQTGEADALTVYQSGHTGITIRTGGTSNNTAIYFADGTSGDQNYRGSVTYTHANDSLVFKTAGNNERLRIKSAGGFTFQQGNTNYPTDFIGGASNGRNYVRLQAGNTTSGHSSGFKLNHSDGNGVMSMFINHNEDHGHFMNEHQGGDILFYTNQSGSSLEKLRITSAGQIRKAQGANVTSLKTYNSNADAFWLDHYQYQVSSTYQRYADIVSIGDSTWGSNIRFFTNANGSANGIERLRIDSSGNSIFKGSGTDVTISPTDGLINFGMDGRTSFVTGTNACYIYSGSGASGDIPAGTLILQARSNVGRDIVMVTGTTPAERLRIDSSGNITAVNTASGGQSVTLKVGASNNTGMNDGIIKIVNGGTGNGVLQWDYEGNANRAQIYVYRSTQDLIFTTAGTERLRIRADGRTELRKDSTCLRLMPTTSGTAVYIEFYDDGNSSRQGFFGFGSNTETNSTMHMHNNRNGHLEFRTNNTVHFRINSNGDLQGTDTSISSLSDSRLKKNVADFVYDLSKFKQFKPKTFEWINTDKHNSGTQRGFIAQDLEGVDAELTGESSLDAELQASDITTLGSDKAKTARLGKNDTIYVSVIQQLITKIETLETKVAALESA